MNTNALPDTQVWWKTQAWADATVSTPLPHLGVIAAHGPDAATFLHGQLSQDVKQLPATEARLAAYCSAKGRMLASFIVLHPAPDTYWLVINRETLPAVLKRLSMFVMRSKLKLSDITDSAALTGSLSLADATSPAADQAMPVTQLDAGSEGVLPTLGCQLPAVQGVSRQLTLGPVAIATAEAPSVLSAWRWLEVMAGVPQIEPATSEQFVPQMVNFELLGGVNFKKGCYPGQEVVARSQYRGTTKRRAFVLIGDAPAAPGAELFCSADPGQPCGMVVNAAAVPGGSAQAVLAELKLASVEAMSNGASLHLGAIDGPSLALGPQPIALPRAEEAAG
jgi:folate-binding protein YgfZ